MPITANVCSISFSAGGSRSMRAARIPWTVAGRCTCDSSRATLTVPLRTSTPSSNNAWMISSMKNGLPWLRSATIRLTGASLDCVTQQRAKHRVRAFARQWIEPQLRVVGAAAPFMAVFGPIVNQQQDARIGN